MEKKQALKMFLILFFSTAYIFSFSQFGVKAYESFLHGDQYFLEGTKIASVSVEGKTKNEAMKLVDEKLTEWLDETTITLKYKEKEQPLELLDTFDFDVETSVSNAKQGVSNPAVVNVLPLDEALISLSSTLLDDKVLDRERLEGVLLEIAQTFSTGSHQIKLEDFLQDSSLMKAVAIQETTMDFGSAINEIAPLLDAKIEINGKSQFSLIQFLEEQHLGNLSSELLSKIATSVYEVILPTNFVIIERHISNELPEYAELGFEAKINPKKNFDLIFANPNDSKYTIRFKKDGNKVKTVLKGSEFLNKYKIVTSDNQTFKSKTVKQYNPLLEPEEVQVKERGKEGRLIKVYREIYDENGSLLKKELISEDFYPPVYRVEVRGLIPSSAEEEEELTDEPVPSDEQSEEGKSENASSTERGENSGKSSGKINQIENTRQNDSQTNKGRKLNNDKTSIQSQR